MTTIISRAFPAPSYDADEPLRLRRDARPQGVRIDAARQLRLGLWLVLLIAVGFGATLAARPPVVDDARLSTLSAPARPVIQAIRPAARLAMAEVR